METSYDPHNSPPVLKLHGSYLQGMETYYTPLNVFVKPNSTDPTYKEWKHIGADLEINDDLKHGSYLQGMETALFLSQLQQTCLHGSYLQGMETSRG